MPRSVLWELGGRTGKPLTCRLLASDDGLFELTVAAGPDQIMAERFRHHRDALQQAEFLRADFGAQGWTELYRRD
jgi:hypothetical protein